MTMEKMNGLGLVMPKVFALFTAGALASLALPGMSGFVSELSVFVGLTSSDIYNDLFRTICIFLASLGVILTPIYLLSMLRQIFFVSDIPSACDLMPVCDLNDTKLKNEGDQEAVCFGTSCVLPIAADFSDARPREVFIALCLLVPIVALGMYPKMVTQLYDTTTVAINAQARQTYQQVAQTPLSPPGFRVSDATIGWPD
jgi:NAD(P)H-quinone oxidoreductase subunit 4